MDSARFNPRAFTRIRSSPGPGSGTSTSLNSRTSGPPVDANSMTRAILVLHKLLEVGSSDRHSDLADLRSLTAPDGIVSVWALGCRTLAGESPISFYDL